MCVEGVVVETREGAPVASVRVCNQTGKQNKVKGNQKTKQEKEPNKGENKEGGGEGGRQRTQLGKYLDGASAKF
jgi:hypothetical protein